MFGRKKLKRDKKALSAEVLEENIVESGEKVLDAKAEEEIFVTAEVEKIVEAVAEDNIIAEVEKEEIVFLEATLDEDLSNEEMVQVDEEKTDEALKIAEAARKVAEAAHKLAPEDVDDKKDEIESEVAKEGEKVDGKIEDTTKADKTKAEEDKATETKTSDVKPQDKEGSETAAIEKIILDAEVTDDKSSDKKDGAIMTGPMKEVEPQEEDDANADLDDMDIPKPPKLAKLPIFIDYCVSQNLKFKTYVKVAKVLLSTLKTFNNSPENKAIAMACIKKLVPALVKAKAEKKK